MLTEQEIKNLEVVFALARQASVNSEEQLVGVINFKQILFDKLVPKTKGELKTDKAKENGIDKKVDNIESPSN